MDTVTAITFRYRRTGPFLSDRIIDYFFSTENCPITQSHLARVLCENPNSVRREVQQMRAQGVLVVVGYQRLTGADRPVLALAGAYYADPFFASTPSAVDTQADGSTEAESLAGTSV